MRRTRKLPFTFRTRSTSIAVALLCSFPEGRSVFWTESTMWSTIIAALGREACSFEIVEARFLTSKFSDRFQRSSSGISLLEHRGSSRNLTAGLYRPWVWPPVFYQTHKLGLSPSPPRVTFHSMWHSAFEAVGCWRRSNANKGATLTLNKWEPPTACDV